MSRVADFDLVATKSISMMKPQSKITDGCPTNEVY